MLLPAFALLALLVLLAGTSSSAIALLHAIAQYTPGSSLYVERRFKHNAGHPRSNMHPLATCLMLNLKRTG
jgi:hypothetical protein